MDVSSLLHDPGSVLDVTLFRLGAVPLTVGTLVAAGATVVATYVAAKLVKRFVRKRFAMRGPDARAGGAVAAQLLQYGILAVGFSVAVQTVGINLSALFAAGAVFAIGLGFAMQNIAQNFVAG